MNSKSALAILLFSFIQIGAFAQIDVLAPPTAAEKAEITKVLNTYQGFMQLMSEPGKDSEKKTESIKILRSIENANIFVVNDLDSLSKEDEYLNFFKYTQKLPGTIGKKGAQTIVFSKLMSLDKVKYDKVRRYYFVEAKVDKIFKWVNVVERKEIDAAAMDSLANIAPEDSLSKIAVDTIYKTVVDSVTQMWKQKLSFYIKFDRENNISKNFRLLAISKAGKPAKLEPLPELITWWLELDAEWKAVFRKRFPKMEEYPREFDVMKVTGLSEVDVSGSKINTLEPLKKFAYLQKLTIAQTEVKSLEPIFAMKNLKYLDFSNTKVDTLKGLDNLTGLEELYFRAIGIVDISPVKKLTNLVKLDCSENRIEDISALKNLLLLKELHFSLNIRIKDISPLKDLVALEKLSMRKIDIGNLSHLSKMENLVFLDVFNTNITSLEPIRNLQKIFHLDISHNKITSLEPIKNYRFIAYLSLASTSVLDLSVIKNFVHLREIDISNNLITALGPIHKLEYLKTLKCYYTKIDKNEVARFKKNHPNCAITYYY